MTGRVWTSLLVAACSPNYGNTRCSRQGACPDGFTCDAQGHCQRPGHDAGPGDDGPGPDGPGSGSDGSTPAPPTFKGYDADEGGEIRVEHIRFPSGTAGTRVVVYLYADPGSTKRFPFSNLDGCTDETDNQHWPVATNPPSEQTYLVPDKVVVTSRSSLVVPRVDETAPDFLGRVHPVDDWFAYFSPTDGDAFLAPDTTYDIRLDGSSDVPAQKFENVAFMPADFSLTTPGLETVALKAATPMTFQWTVAASSPPAGVAITSLVALGGPAGDAAVICQGPNNGSLTVPASFVDVVRARYPMGGVVVRQTLTHVARELVGNAGPTGRRIDLISAWSYATPYAVQ